MVYQIVKSKEPDNYRIRWQLHFQNDACNLELVVKAYNINKGRNVEIAKKSPTLSGYGEFVAEINENLKTMNLNVAIKTAVRTCIRKKILLSFFKSCSSEVENMLFTEWNLKDALEVRYEESEARGLDKGREEVFSLLESGMSLAEAANWACLKPVPTLCVYCCIFMLIL
jgi:hypothetical protein